MATTPRPAFCNEKQRLITEFTRATSDYLRMQSARLISLIDGDGFQFVSEIKAAAKIKDEARDAVLDHERQHGC